MRRKGVRCVRGEDDGCNVESQRIMWIPVHKRRQPSSALVPMAWHIGSIISQSLVLRRNECIVESPCWNATSAWLRCGLGNLPALVACVLHMWDKGMLWIFIITRRKLRINGSKEEEIMGLGKIIYLKMNRYELINLDLCRSRSYHVLDCTKAYMQKIEMQSPYINKQPNGSNVHTYTHTRKHDWMLLQGHSWSHKFYTVGLNVTGAVFAVSSSVVQ